MKVATSRIDSWIIKGFDGLSDYLVERANREEPVEEAVVQQIGRAILRLDECLMVRQQAVTDDTDTILGISAFLLSELVRKRAFELGLGTLTEGEQENLRKHLIKMRSAVQKMKEKLNAVEPVQG